MNGCPTISLAERRRLQREAELERRAQKIRDDEKRKKDNAQKRKEKEEHDKEIKKRMGIREEIKLPEGQLGLSQFFTRRATRSMAKTAMVQQETLPDQLEKTDTPLASDTGGDDLASIREDEEQDNPRGYNGNTAAGNRVFPSRTSTKEQLQNDNLPPTVSTVEERKHWFSTPKSLKCDKQLENQSDIPRLTEQHPTSCKPVAIPCSLVDTEVVPPTQLQSSQELAYRPILASLDQNTERKQETEQAEITFPAYEVLPEDRTANTRSNSLPSILLKRNLQQAGFDQLEFADDKNTTTPITLSNKKPRTSSLGSLTIDAASLRQLAATLHTPLAASGAVTFDQSPGKNGFTLTSDVMNAKSVIFQHQNAVQASAESFCEGLSDEDFNALDDPGSSHPKEGIRLIQEVSQSKKPSLSSQGLRKETKRNPRAQEINKYAASPINSKRTSISKKLSPLKAASARTNSTQSSVCDFSSQDYAELEKMIKTPRQVDKTRSMLPAEKTQSQALQSTIVNSSFDDNFDFPGCTQALAALVDSDIQSSQSPSPNTTRKASPNPKAKAHMLPPPLPLVPLSPHQPHRSFASYGTSRRPSAQSDDSDDIFNYFAGSTQALLDL